MRGGTRKASIPSWSTEATVISEQADITGHEDLAENIVQYNRIWKRLSLLSEYMQMAANTKPVTPLAKGVLAAMGEEEAVGLIPDLSCLSLPSPVVLAWPDIFAEIDASFPEHPWEKPLDRACGKFAVWLNAFSSCEVWLAIDYLEDLDLDVFGELDKIAEELGVSSAYAALEEDVSPADILV